MGSAARKPVLQGDPVVHSSTPGVGERVEREDIRIELASDPKLLRSVRALVRTYLLSADVDSERASEIVLGVDEACTNVIRHSYGGRPDGRLQLSMQCTDEAIVFRLCDSGDPVSLERCARREMSTVDEIARDGGGLGVQLMYRVFDSVNYSPGLETGNCVTLRVQRASTRAKCGDHGA
ncbi:MAG: ATP-binding protein [Candidatus Hydrogenedentes bacterium]|nr:ATP-binding protein [Candidatus Hydrogenedentota bacterium]